MIYDSPKHVVSKACMLGVLQTNPISFYKAKHIPKDRGFWNNEELQQIMNVKFKKASHELIRDLFIFYNILRKIRIDCGIKTKLTYHIARHSFGTLMLSAGIPIESISKMMRHTNISSIQIYSKVTDDKISEDMDKLMERRKAVSNKVSQPIEL